MSECASPQTEEHHPGKLRLCLGLASSLTAVALGLALFGPQGLWVAVGKPLTRMVVFISLGLLVGQLLEGTGYSVKIGHLVRPLIAWAHLPAQSGTAFTAAFVSGLTANSLLYTGWQEGRINRRQLIFSNLLNASLPTYLLHLPTTLLVALPLIGSAGLIYLSLTLAAAVVRLVLTAFVARTLLPEPEPAEPVSPASRPGWRAVWQETWPKFKRRLARMVLLVVPIYMSISLAVELGFFQWLKSVLAGWVSAAFLPVEAVSVVVFALMAELPSGFAAAGALMEAGQLNTKQVVLALLLGAMLSAVVRALRHQMSYYVAIYSPKMGLTLLAIGQSCRVVSLMIVTAFFVILF
ncbi:MAG: nucleoside recognition protein [Deltaproteobacteria bacterium]|nr:nucleoside recognition protein [Deltaproteobacteria bacterium]